MHFTEAAGERLLLLPKDGSLSFGERLGGQRSAGWNPGPALLTLGLLLLFKLLQQGSCEVRPIAPSGGLFLLLFCISGL